MCSEVPALLEFGDLHSLQSGKISHWASVYWKVMKKMMVKHNPTKMRLRRDKASRGWFYKLHFHRGVRKKSLARKIKRIFFKRKNQKDFFGSRKTSKCCYIHCIVKDYQLNLVASEGNITITIKKTEPFNPLPTGGRNSPSLELE